MPQLSGNTGAAIFDILSNDSDVSSIYSSRIYPNITNFDNTTYPMIIYTMTSTEPTNTKTSTSTLDVVDFQLALFHTTYQEMIVGQGFVRQALDYKEEGNYPTTGSFSVKVQSISFQDDRQDYIDDFNEQGLFVSYMTFQIRQKR